MFFEAIYESLNWSRHVKAVLSKMSRYVGILYKIKRYLVTLDRYTIALCNCIQIFDLEIFPKSNIDTLFSKNGGCGQLFLNS